MKPAKVPRMNDEPDDLNLSADTTADGDVLDPDIVIRQVVSPKTEFQPMSFVLDTSTEDETMDQRIGQHFNIARADKTDHLTFAPFLRQRSRDSPHKSPPAQASRRVLFNQSSEDIEFNVHERVRHHSLAALKCQESSAVHDETCSSHASEGNLGEGILSTSLTGRVAAHCEKNESRESFQPYSTTADPQLNSTNESFMTDICEVPETSNHTTYWSTPHKPDVPLQFSETVSPVKENQYSDDPDSEVTSFSSSDSSVKSVSFTSLVSWKSAEERDEEDDCLSDEVDDPDAIMPAPLLETEESQHNDTVNESIASEIPPPRHFVWSSLKIHSHSSLSVNEAVLNVMELYLKNGESKAGLGRILKTMSKMLPSIHHMPTSSHLLLDYVKSLAPPAAAITHFYCSDCLLYHGREVNGKCDVCLIDEPKFSKFFEFDVAVCIKYLFECRNLAQAMDLFHQTDNTGGFKDIKDGSVYQAMNVNRSRYDVSLVLYKDGVRIRKTGGAELWLVMVVPVEVPIHLRPSFILVVGVWYDKPKPNMNSFLKPLSEKLRALHTKGVKWEHPSTSELHESRVTVPLCVADAPARAKAQNILGHNGKYGCNTCEIKAMRSAWVPGKRRTLYYPYSHSPVLRTEARMTLQAMRALREGKTFKGVKGPSVLSIIPSLDISCSFVPEYMHSVLLGVVKQIVSLWCSTQEPWMVMNRIPFIDNILSSVKHPDFVHRTGRTLKMLKYWKASDFYYFLLFESVLILKDYLPDVYLQHYFLLVKGIFLLLKKNVSELEISIAESLLKLFVSKFLDLYGDRAMSYNVHQLCHLALCVRKYGPLYANSAFMFEDVNGLVASATHGTNNVAVEIVNNIVIAQGVHRLRNIVRGVGDNIQSGPCKAGQVLGKPTKDRLLPSQSELESLNGAAYEIFSRAQIGYDTFTSEAHKVLGSENFYVMWQVEGEPRHYGSIKYFAKTPAQLYVCFRLYEIDHLQYFFNRETMQTLDHLIPVNKSNDTVVVEVNAVTSIVKLGKIGSHFYKRPNLYQFVL